MLQNGSVLVMRKKRGGRNAVRKVTHYIMARRNNLSGLLVHSSKPALLALVLTAMFAQNYRFSVCCSGFVRVNEAIATRAA